MYGIFIFLMVIATIALTIGWTAVFTDGFGIDKVKKELSEDVKNGSVKMYAIMWATIILCCIWTIIIIK